MKRNCLMGTGLYVRMMNIVWTRQKWLYNTVNVPNATEIVHFKMAFLLCEFHVNLPKEKEKEWRTNTNYNMEEPYKNYVTRM